MRRKPRTAFLLCTLAIIAFSAFSIHLSRNALSAWPLPLLSEFDSPLRTTTNNRRVVTILHHKNSILDDAHPLPHPTRRVSSIDDSISTVSVLLPDWEILLIVSPLSPPPHSGDQHHCLFRNNDKTPATFSGVLPFTNCTTFKCHMPESVRRRRIFSQPKLVRLSENDSSDQSPAPAPAPELLRWNFLVYESFSTEDDVVLFAKGVNSHQGHDRSPNELRCVFFGHGSGVKNAVGTPVTSSVQEVFRCPHPDPSELGLGSDDYQLYQGQGGEKIGVSVEIIGQNFVVPSVAYYMPRPKPRPKPNAVSLQAQPRHMLCACTMVYNVAKFLREWVMYHSKVGVDKFLLYDNGSEDDLEGVIKELRGEGYNISTLLWIWPKTQEAGFSHSVLYAKSKEMCSWIMYVDVDEFAFSPSWDGDGSSASLKSLLPESGRRSAVGQLSMACLEFGPSGQRKHPVEGVTQGYTCRRRADQRHKSVVRVEAVDPSLWNVIHHFKVNEKEGFVSRQVGLEEGVVNHYKYQAWDEFKTKFRRRVSAYVVDWTQAVNPNSKDRTPGLGFEPVEPRDWIHRFCEVRDERLKAFTTQWFGSFSTTPKHTT